MGSAKTGTSEGLAQLYASWPQTGHNGGQTRNIGAQVPGQKDCGTATDETRSNQMWMHVKHMQKPK